MRRADIGAMGTVLEPNLRSDDSRPSRSPIEFSYARRGLASGPEALIWTARYAPSQHPYQRTRPLLVIVLIIAVRKVPWTPSGRIAVGDFDQFWRNVQIARLELVVTGDPRVLAPTDLTEHVPRKPQ